ADGAERRDATAGGRHVRLEVADRVNGVEVLGVVVDEHRPAERVDALVGDRRGRSLRRTHGDTGWRDDLAEVVDEHGVAPRLPAVVALDVELTFGDEVVVDEEL